MFAKKFKEIVVDSHSVGKKRLIIRVYPDGELKGEAIIQFKHFGQTTYVYTTEQYLTVVLKQYAEPSHYW